MSREGRSSCARSPPKVIRAPEEGWCEPFARIRSARPCLDCRWQIEVFAREKRAQPPRIREADRGVPDQGVSGHAAASGGAGEAEARWGVEELPIGEVEPGRSRP